MLPDTPDGDEIKAWKSKMAELLVADTDEDMRLGGPSGCYMDLPLDLSFETKLLQFALSTGIIEPSHVHLVGLTRMLLHVIGEEHLLPLRAREILKSYNLTKQIRLGRAATCIDRGFADKHSAGMHQKEQIAQTNSGAYSISTLVADAPLASALPGPQESGYLNMLEAAKVRGGARATTQDPKKYPALESQMPM